MKIHLLNLLIFITMVSVFACKRPEKIFSVEFDPLLNSPVFEKSFLSHVYEAKDSLRVDWNKYQIGDTIFREDRSKIIETNCPNITKEKVYDYLGIQAYKSNDTIFLLLETDLGSLDIEIHKNHFSASEFIFSHYSLGFRKGEGSKSSLIIPIDKGNLIIKNKNLTTGDRIYGFLFFETKEFFENGFPNSNYFRGAFTAIIQNKEEFFKHHPPRIFI